MTTKKKKICCNDCGKEFVYRKSLSGHKRNCEKNNPLLCRICEKTFTKKDYMQRHLISCKKKRRDKKYTCDVCCKLFRNNWFLRRHQPCRASLKCMQCNRTFRHLKSFQLHTQTCNDDSGKICKEINKEQGESLLPDSSSFKNSNWNSEEIDSYVSVENTNESKDNMFVNTNNANKKNRDFSLIDNIVKLSSEELTETKVYILDDMCLDDEKNYPTESCVIDSLENTSERYNLQRQGRNRLAAEQVTSYIKDIFETENVTNRDDILIMKMVLENLGLHHRFMEKIEEVESVTS